jgi:hypothetical protein
MKKFATCIILISLIVSAPVLTYAATKGVKKAVKKTAPVKKSVPAIQPLTIQKPIASPVENKPEISLPLIPQKSVAISSDVKVGGVIFFRWQKYLQNGGSNVNNFDIDRAYINFNKNFDSGAAARLTLDVARITGTAKQNDFSYLKYAYVDLPFSVSAVQFIPFTMSARLGLQQTAWIDWDEKALNLRFIAKTLLDDQGIMSSADFGVGLMGKFVLGSLPSIDYQATILNGTGYATNETDAKKATALRLSAIAYDMGNSGKIIIGGLINVEGLDSTLSLNSSNKQEALELAYKHDLGVANFEYLAGSKNNKKIAGYSLGGELKTGALISWLPNTNLFARYDNYDPNTNNANDEIVKIFYGIIYDWDKDIKLSADMQNSQTGNGAVVSILYLHTLITL